MNDCLFVKKLFINYNIYLLTSYNTHMKYFTKLIVFMV